MSVTTTGFERLRRNIGGVQRAIEREQLKKITERAVRPVVDRARSLASRISTRGAREIDAVVTRTEKLRVSVDIGVDVKRFDLLLWETGTRQHGAKPWLRPAMAEKQPAALNAMRDGINASFRRHVR